MIQRAFITAWRRQAPWPEDAQIEQDLVLSRALVDLFRDPTVRASLAFRGGTALHKLFFAKPTRYSEDIDFVQVEAGPIGPIMDAARRCLDPWLGKPQWKQGRDRVTLIYRFTTEIEPVTRSRLKLEVNTREHFSVLGFTSRSFSVENGWFNGSTEITTYHIDELLGTKMRALYQRRKGRDLFDLWMSAQRIEIDPTRMIECFRRYIAHDGLSVSRAEFEKNLISKLSNPEFAADLKTLLAVGVEWGYAEAGRYILQELAPLLPGKSWRGEV